MQQNEAGPVILISMPADANLPYSSLPNCWSAPVINQFLRRKAVVAKALTNKFLRRDLRPYDDSSWWDQSFYTNGISDRQTIHANKHRLSAQYHYSSVELQILRHLYNNRIQDRAKLWGPKVSDSNALQSAHVLDVGSGSGHWIRFYHSLGVESITGIDISRRSADHLNSTFSSDSGISIVHGDALSFLTNANQSFDLINAIGVMFHIIDDQKWSDTVAAMANCLADRGIVVFGGHFGRLDGLNVQVDQNGHVTKRLRSIRNWRRHLAKAGLSKTYLYRNNAYLWINDPLPENHVLIAHK